MTRAHRLQVAIALGCLITACGEPSDPAARETDSAEESTPEREAAPLAESFAEFEVGGSTVEFYADGAGPDATILTRVSASPESGNPLDELVLRYGPLTNLEEFLALAPDVVPHPALVATHPEQATAIGRPDDSVLHVDPLAGVTIVSLGF